MLRRLFGRSLLAQLKEAREAYRELRIASYRGALKAKRAAVRAAVYRELRQSQLQQWIKRRDAALELMAMQARVKHAEAYKADTGARVRALVHENASDGPATRIVAGAVEGAVANTRVDPNADKAAMAAQVVAGVAASAEVSNSELIEMIRTIAPNEPVMQREIHRNLMAALVQARADANVAQQSPADVSTEDAVGRAPPLHAKGELE